MSSQKPSDKSTQERRGNGERRNDADNRRAHDRFSPGQKTSERRQEKRRSDRSSRSS